jgi:hypothetical protein
MFAKAIVRNIADLEAACGSAHLDAIYDEVAAWCARAREAHRRVSAALEAANTARPAPHPAAITLDELYPSIAGLLAVDARLAGGEGEELRSARTAPSGSRRRTSTDRTSRSS